MRTVAVTANKKIKAFWKRELLAAKYITMKTTIKTDAIDCDVDIPNIFLYPCILLLSIYIIFIQFYVLSIQYMCGSYIYHMIGIFSDSFWFICIKIDLLKVLTIKYLFKLWS